MTPKQEAKKMFEMWLIDMPPKLYNLREDTMFNRHFFIRKCAIKHCEGLLKEHEKNIIEIGQLKRRRSLKLVLEILKSEL